MNWKPVPRSNGHMVSDAGFVKSMRSERLMKGSLDRYGYKQVLICGTQRRVHRIVCEAFHGPPPSAKHHAAHIDGNRANNQSSNLRWATAEENVADQIAHGTFPYRNLRPKASRISADTVLRMKADAANGLGGRRLAKKYGISRSTAHRLIVKPLTEGETPK